MLLKYEQKYQEMLDVMESLRNEIIQEHVDDISFRGKFPPEVYDQINQVIQLETSVFQYLRTQGITYKEVVDKPQLVTFIVNQKEYIGVKKMIGIVEENIESKEESPSIQIKQETKPTTEPSEAKIPEDEKQLNITPIQEEDNLDLEIPESKGATIIGETTNFSTENQITPEFSTLKQDLVYEKITIKLQHKGYERIEDVFDVVCAPLRLCKYANPSVPILISISDKNRRVTKSSYDSYEHGRNLVTVDIKDYALLCRGSFDANGNFHTILTTTDKSANQGDILTVISQESYGMETTRTSHNGHPVLPYISDEGESFIRIIPLGNIGEENFIIVSKTEEFVNYMQSASETNGAYKATIEDNHIIKQIIPYWTDNALEVEILEG